MVYYSGGTPQRVWRFSGCKRRLLQSWWVVEDCFLGKEGVPTW